MWQFTVHFVMWSPFLMCACTKFFSAKHTSFIVKNINDCCLFQLPVFDPAKYQYKANVLVLLLHQYSFHLRLQYIYKYIYSVAHTDEFVGIRTMVLPYFHPADAFILFFLFFVTVICWCYMYTHVCCFLLFCP